MPDRVRQIPNGNFSWVDQRLLFNGHLARLHSAEALALYLFLIVVADAQGLSYYSDRKIASTLGFELEQLSVARTALKRAHLIAYSSPLYQVLSLDPAPTATTRSRTTNSTNAPQSIAEILKPFILKGESR